MDLEGAQATHCTCPRNCGWRAGK